MFLSKAFKASLTSFAWYTIFKKIESLYKFKRQLVVQTWSIIFDGLFSSAQCTHLVLCRGIVFPVDLVNGPFWMMYHSGIVMQDTYFMCVAFFGQASYGFAVPGIQNYFLVLFSENFAVSNWVDNFATIFQFHFSSCYVIKFEWCRFLMNFNESINGVYRTLENFHCVQRIDIRTVTVTQYRASRK